MRVQIEGLQGNKEEFFLGGCVRAWHLFVEGSLCAGHCSEYAVGTGSFPPPLEGEKPGLSEVRPEVAGPVTVRVGT